MVFLTLFLQLLKLWPLERTGSYKLICYYGSLSHFHISFTEALSIFFLQSFILEQKYLWRSNSFLPKDPYISAGHIMSACHILTNGDVCQKWWDIWFKLRFEDTRVRLSWFLPTFQWHTIAKGLRFPYYERKMLQQLENRRLPWKNFYSHTSSDPGGLFFPPRVVPHII